MTGGRHGSRGRALLGGLVLLLGDPAAGAAAEGSQRAAGGPGPSRPNIVWITVEDMSPWLGCYGDPVAQTPRLDALAREAMRYTNAHATTPVCAPARAALITGCYATRTGAMHMRTGNPSKASLERDPGAYDGVPTYEATPAPEVRCFPELLRRAGYWCTNRAKTDYQFRAPATTWDQSGRGAHWRHRPDPEQPFFAVFNLGVTHESGTFPSTRRQPAVTAPAEVQVPPYYPDTPVVREVIARTYDNIAAMDRQVGTLLDELEEAGLLESTWVFWFTDHGVGLPRGKRAIYASGTHVPMLVRPPGGRAAVEDRLVSFVDLAPTVLSLAGIQPPDWMDGVAFLGSHMAAAPEFVFLHADRMDASLDRTRAVTDGAFRLVWNGFTDRPRLYPVAYAENIPLMADLHALIARGGDRPEQWQIVDPYKPAREFYVRANDPHEVHNRIDAPEHAPRIAHMQAALEGWIAETGDLGLLPEGAMVRQVLWSPSGEQPVTAPPSLVAPADGAPSLTCATEGASLGWRLPGEAGWRVLGPLPAGKAIEVRAHRIGFQPSEVVRLEVPVAEDLQPRRASASGGE